MIFLLLLFFANGFLREGRWVCKACATAKQWCATAGGTPSRCPGRRRKTWRKGGKKQKRKEDKEAAEAEFSLVVEDLWGRVVRKWEELERWQEQRWAIVMVTLGHIVDGVRELLDRLMLEEKEKGKEKGVETDAEEMEMEEMEEMEEVEEVEESGETGVGAEKDGEGDMEVEETLKKVEKLADEAERVEKDVMEEQELFVE